MPRPAAPGGGPTTLKIGKNEIPDGGGGTTRRIETPFTVTHVQITKDAGGNIILELKCQP